MLDRTSGPLLEIKDLHAWYGESHILHGTTFNVNAGEVVTLLGRNGAGKTTTLKSVMGIVGKRTGSVKFEGRELIKLQSDVIARAGLAFCPEERGIFASLDVEENLMLPPQVRSGGLSREQDFRTVPEFARASEKPGHETLRRRTADARDWPHPAHRCAASLARRADRGLGAGHHSADRQHDPQAERAGLHHSARRTEFPLRIHGGGPLLHHGARESWNSSPIPN